MKNFWQEKARDEIVNRLHALQPEAQPRWGRMNIAQMVCHCSDQVRMALGDIPFKGMRGPFRFWPLNVLMIYVMPWPKGKAKGPEETFTTSPTKWQEDMAQLEKLIRRFGEQDRNAAWPLHPLFGKLSGAAWGALTYRHFDHHLRQFGV
ncbi:MAG: DinB family protein [bacterium]